MGAVRVNTDDLFDTSSEASDDDGESLKHSSTTTTDRELSRIIRADSSTSAPRGGPSIKNSTKNSRTGQANEHAHAHAASVNDVAVNMNIPQSNYSNSMPIQKKQRSLSQQQQSWKSRGKRMQSEATALQQIAMTAIPVTKKKKKKKKNKNSPISANTSTTNENANNAVPISTGAGASSAIISANMGMSNNMSMSMKSKQSNNNNNVSTSSIGNIHLDSKNTSNKSTSSKSTSNNINKVKTGVNTSQDQSSLLKESLKGSSNDSTAADMKKNTRKSSNSNTNSNSNNRDDGNVNKKTTKTATAAASATKNRIGKKKTAAMEKPRSTKVKVPTKSSGSNSKKDGTNNGSNSSSSNINNNSGKNNPNAPLRIDSESINLMDMKPKLGMHLEACDQENIWSTAKIVKIHKAKNESESTSPLSNHNYNRNNKRRRTRSKISGTKVTIRYDGWGKEWDETLHFYNEDRIATLGTHTLRFKCMVDLIELRGSGPSSPSSPSKNNSMKNNPSRTSPRKGGSTSTSTTHPSSPSSSQSSQSSQSAWPCIVNVRTPSSLVANIDSYYLAEEALRLEPNIFIEPYGLRKNYLPFDITSTSVNGGRWIKREELVHGWRERSEGERKKKTKLANNFNLAYKMALKDDSVLELPVDAFIGGTLIKAMFRDPPVGYEEYSDSEAGSGASDASGDEEGKGEFHVGVDMDDDEEQEMNFDEKNDSRQQPELDEFDNVDDEEQELNFDDEEDAEIRIDNDSENVIMSKNSNLTSVSKSIVRPRESHAKNRWDQEKRVLTEVDVSSSISTSNETIHGNKSNKSDGNRGNTKTNKSKSHHASKRDGTDPDMQKTTSKKASSTLSLLPKPSEKIKKNFAPTKTDHLKKQQKSKSKRHLTPQLNEDKDDRNHRYNSCTNTSGSDNKRNSIVKRIPKKKTLLTSAATKTTKSDHPQKQLQQQNQRRETPYLSDDSSNGSLSSTYSSSSMNTYHDDENGSRNSIDTGNKKSSKSTSSIISTKNRIPRKKKIHPENSGCSKVTTSTNNICETPAMIHNSSASHYDDKNEAKQQLILSLRAKIANAKSKKAQKSKVISPDENDRSTKKSTLEKEIEKANGLIFQKRMKLHAPTSSDVYDDGDDHAIPVDVDDNVKSKDFEKNNLSVLCSNNNCYSNSIEKEIGKSNGNHKASKEVTPSLSSASDNEGKKPFLKSLAVDVVDNNESQVGESISIALRIQQKKYEEKMSSASSRILFRKDNADDSPRILEGTKKETEATSEASAQDTKDEPITKSKNTKETTNIKELGSNGQRDKCNYPPKNDIVAHVPQIIRDNVTVNDKAKVMKHIPIKKDDTRTNSDVIASISQIVKDNVATNSKGDDMKQISSKKHDNHANYRAIIKSLRLRVLRRSMSNTTKTSVHDNNAENIIDYREKNSSIFHVDEKLVAEVKSGVKNTSHILKETVAKIDASATVTIEGVVNQTIPSFDTKAKHLNLPCNKIIVKDTKICEKEIQAIGPKPNEVGFNRVGLSEVNGLDLWHKIVCAKKSENLLEVASVVTGMISEPGTVAKVTRSDESKVHATVGCGSEKLVSNIIMSNNEKRSLITINSRIPKKKRKLNYSSADTNSQSKQSRSITDIDSEREENSAQIDISTHSEISRPYAFDIDNTKRKKTEKLKQKAANNENHRAIVNSLRLKISRKTKANSNINYMQDQRKSKGIKVTKAGNETKANVNRESNAKEIDNSADTKLSNKRQSNSHTKLNNLSGSCCTDQFQEGPSSKLNLKDISDLGNSDDVQLSDETHINSHIELDKLIEPSVSHHLEERHTKEGPNSKLTSKEVPDAGNSDDTRLSDTSQIQSQHKLNKFLEPSVMNHLEERSTSESNSNTCPEEEELSKNVSIDKSCSIKEAIFTLNNLHVDINDQEKILKKHCNESTDDALHSNKPCASHSQTNDLSKPTTEQSPENSEAYAASSNVVGLNKSVEEESSTNPSEHTNTIKKDVASKIGDLSEKTSAQLQRKNIARDGMIDGNNRTNNQNECPEKSTEEINKNTLLSAKKEKFMKVKKCKKSDDPKQATKEHLEDHSEDNKKVVSNITREEIAKRTDCLIVHDLLFTGSEKATHEESTKISHQSHEQIRESFGENSEFNVDDGNSFNDTEKDENTHCGINESVLKKMRGPRKTRRATAAFEISSDEQQINQNTSEMDNEHSVHAGSNRKQDATKRPKRVKGGAKNSSRKNGTQKNKDSKGQGNKRKIKTSRSHMGKSAKKVKAHGKGSKEMDYNNTGTAVINLNENSSLADVIKTLRAQNVQGQNMGKTKTNSNSNETPLLSDEAKHNLSLKRSNYIVGLKEPSNKNETVLMAVLRCGGMLNITEPDDAVVRPISNKDQNPKLSANRNREEPETKIDYNGAKKAKVNVENHSNALSNGQTKRLNPAEIFAQLKAERKRKREFQLQKGAHKEKAV